jgi:hypothetical protein
MLSLGLSITSPAVWANGAFVPSNAETATLIAALTGSYSRTLKQAWDDAIGALKASGAWEDFDILYAKGAIPGTSAANIVDGYLNWKNPATYTATPVNSPTNGNGYWQGDGASSRVRTQFTPSTNGVKFTQDSASVWFWCLNDVGLTAYDVGNISTAPHTAIISRSGADSTFARVNTGTSASVANANSTGLFVAQRRGAADQRIWRNGTQISGVSSAASTGLPTQEQWMCGANNNSFSTRREAFAAWGASQSGREAGIYTIIETLLTAAGTI